MTEIVGTKKKICPNFLPEDEVFSLSDVSRPELPLDDTLPPLPPLTPTPPPPSSLPVSFPFFFFAFCLLFSSDVRRRHLEAEVFALGDLVR